MCCATSRFNVTLYIAQILLGMLLTTDDEQLNQFTIDEMIMTWRRRLLMQMANEIDANGKWSIFNVENDCGGGSCS